MENFDVGDASNEDDELVPCLAVDNLLQLLQALEVGCIDSVDVDPGSCCRCSRIA